MLSDSFMIGHAYHLDCCANGLVRWYEVEDEDGG
jgi:hypothetical protein